MSRPGRAYRGPVALRGGSGGAGAGVFTPGRNGAAGRNGDAEQPSAGSRPVPMSPVPMSPVPMSPVPPSHRRRLD